jgi:hypothetical protein
MRCEMPFTVLHEALAAAQHKDMPDIEYKDRDWDAWRKLTPEQQREAVKNKTEVYKDKVRRPYGDEFAVDMFQQTWGSTALGYGGMGGAAITTAYTIVVIYQHRHFCVYFGSGNLAYYVDLNKLSRPGCDAFMSDLKDHVMADVRKASTRYV